MVALLLLLALGTRGEALSVRREGKRGGDPCSRQFLPFRLNMT
jgi:hypothetical protein